MCRRQRSGGTDGSNPAPSTSESGANFTSRVAFSPLKMRHTVRGPFSGTLKKLWFALASGEERGRVYQIAEPASI